MSVSFATYYDKKGHSDERMTFFFLGDIFYSSVAVIVASGTIVSLSEASTVNFL